MIPGVQSRPILRLAGSAAQAMTDAVAIEEPLEIRLNDRCIAVTMRTPGHDVELALGFLFTEDIVTGPREIAAVNAKDNVVAVTLAPGIAVDFERLTRHVYTASSCGVCGKASVDAVFAACPTLPPGGAPIPPSVVHALPERLRAVQMAFGQTGGLHAAALFDREGTLQEAREDVGRHNALDKLIGAALRAERLPLSETLLLVSGRASFELVQKAAMAGIPILAAVGAPSSLAIETAQRVGMTLIGFLRNGRFNLYCGAKRIGPVESSLLSGGA